MLAVYANVTAFLATLWFVMALLGALIIGNVDGIGSREWKKFCAYMGVALGSILFWPLVPLLVPVVVIYFLSQSFKYFIKKETA
jgi:hypothetical protein